MRTDAAYFEQLFAESDDPWSFRTRWYEHRKRALIMATLPRQRYERVFEPACANGELSVLLAQRTRRLLCQDLNAQAVALARQRLADTAHLHGQAQVQVEQAVLPDQWPDGPFDLIVLGEIGYYLSAEAWQDVIERVRHSLTPDGGLLACHWLQPIHGCPQTGAQVHAAIDQYCGLHRLVCHQEADFLLQYWTAAPFEFDLQERCSVELDGE